ncbi:MAG: ADP-heptose--LPS heptosyltransferase, partial [Thermoanaerobaculia bacterium]
MIDAWLSHMRRGDFAAAWAVSDAILAEHAGVPCFHLPRHEQWVWDGTPLANKRVLIRCYHGLGDTIQFARFFPLVNAIAAETTVWAQASLLPLLETVPGMPRLLPLHGGTPEVEYDVDVESMELTHVFRTTLDTLPKRIPYFDVKPMRIPRNRRLAVGVNLQSGDWDPNRSIAVDFELPDVDVYRLELGADPRTADPLSTARLIRALDVVISVDTMTAHLAGALGIPTFTLLPFYCDWRW